MIRFSIGARIRLLVVCLTALITLLFAGIGWIILLDAEDAIHDAYVTTGARAIAEGNNPDLRPAGVSAYRHACFLQ